MTPEQFEDAKLAASMANNARSYFADRFQGNSASQLGGILPDASLRVDPKKVIMRDWKQYASEIQNPTQPQYQQPVVPFGHGLPQDGIQAPIKPLLPVPVGVNPDGSIIMGNPLQSLQQPVNTPQFQPQYEQPLQTTGFQLPSFGKPQEKLAVDEDQFEKLAKELKSVKSLVNKLIRQVAEIKVIIQPQQEKEIENTDQS
jgi:hypothetical protein